VNGWERYFRASERQDNFLVIKKTRPRLIQKNVSVQLIQDFHSSGKMHKSSSFNGLLGGDGLQSRWRQTTGTSFIRRKSKFKFHFVYLLASFLLILIVYVSLPSSKKAFTSSYNEMPTSSLLAPSINYNSTYPLTRPINNPHNHHIIYRIAMIADLDTNSKRDKSKSMYTSYIKRGHLTVGPSHSTFEFKWDEEDSIEITSGYSLKGKSTTLLLIVCTNVLRLFPAF
jgi:Apyrase